MDVFIHPTATVEKTAKIGSGTRVWHYAHVREGAVIGKNCILGHCAYVDKNVRIGDNVKVENKASLFQGVTIGDDVFIGPHVVFTNDARPRSLGEWKIVKTLVKKGASIGANSTILCGIVIGAHSMIGAGSVVTEDVPDHCLVYGNPARIRGFVCQCGDDLEESGKDKGFFILKCRKCKKNVKMPENIFIKTGR